MIPGTTVDNTNSSDEEEGVDDRDVCGVKLQAAEFEHLLCPFADDDDENVDTTGKKLRKQQRKTLLQREYKNAMEISRAVWCTDATYTPTRERTNEGQMFAETFEDHLKAKRQRRSDAVVPSAPFDQQRNAAASWSKPNAHANLDAVFAEINSQAESPNQEQRAFLRHFVARLKLEIVEQQFQRISTSVEEPLLDLVHGFPGTGKSRVIQWMRELMEKGLGWEHGVQFVCLQRIS